MGQSSTPGDGAASTDAADILDPAERERLREMGRAIRDLRTAENLALDDLVARAKANGVRGVSKTTLSNMENGKTDSRLSSYRAAAAALGFTGRDALDAMLAAAARLKAGPQNVEGNPSPKATNPLPETPGGGGVALRHAEPDVNARVAEAARGTLIGPPLVLVYLPVMARANAGPGGGMIAEHERVPIPQAAVEKHDARLLLVSGDCMVPEVAAGDFVLADAALVPHDRDIVAVRVRATDEILVKRYERTADGRVRLSPNIDAPGVGRAYELDERDIETIGVVYSALRPVGRFDLAAMGADGTA